MVKALQKHSPYDDRQDADGIITLTLPIMPPSANNLYVNLPGKGRVRSKEYTAWITQMGLLLQSQCKTRMPVRADLSFAFENKHAGRDASNSLKACEDLLVKVGILKDDRAAYVRSITGTWTEIEGVQIAIMPAQPHVAKQGKGVTVSFAGLPRNHFAAIYVDPPWHFKTYNEKGRQRSPDWKPFKGSLSQHYDTMSAEDIRALPIADVAADDCCLFLWICWPLLPEAVQLIESWGFTYKTCAFDWVKAHARQVEMFQDENAVQIGMGYWTRSNSEVCLLATRGKPKRLNADVRQAIIEPRRQHSRKPDCVYSRIERLVAGPYLELFARATRPGWTSWGNQVGKFAEVSAA